MRLSASFSIDPRENWVIRHNREAREVLEAYSADRPIRVPLLTGEWFGQHGFYADESKLDYRQYYTDPETMLAVQLEAARRRRELPISDIVLAEAPERWPVSVDLWPVVAPGWVGCRIMYRSEAVIAHEGLHLSKADADAMAMPDPATGGLLSTTRRFGDGLRQRCDGMTYLGRPVGPIQHGVGTGGFFSLALDLRGEEIMADMYDDPEFAGRFLRKVAGWTLGLACTWQHITGGSTPVSSSGPEPMYVSDHGIDMLSANTYEEFIVPIIKECNARLGTAVPTALHHCGHGAHLFPVIKRHFGLTSIHALTWPYVDIAKVRRDLGEEVRIQALIADSIIQLGPTEQIRESVKEVMKARGHGGFALILGDMLPGTPLEHRLALYEAVKEFGGY